MQFKFVGNPYALDNRGEIVAFGIRFPLNVAVDVKDERIIRKLMGNHHFAAVDGAKTYHQMPPRLILPDGVKPAESEANGDGASEPKPDGDLNVSKARLIAIAEERGVDIDKRWNADRIRTAIEGGND